MTKLHGLRLPEREQPEPEDDESGPALWFDADSWSEAAIPQRPWIAPGYFLRGAVTVLSGPSSVSKSTLSVAYAAHLALGANLSRMNPHGPVRVLVYNVEDDRHEQQRRFSAVLNGMGRKPADLTGKVFRAGPAWVGTLLGRDPESGAIERTATLRELEQHIVTIRPDVVFLDPLVELHAEEENDNTAVRSVMAHFRTLAVHHNLALVIIHHARKGAAQAAPGDPETLRGASAIIGAARIVITVTSMSEAEAQAFGLKAEDRQHYFRVDTGKSNYSGLGAAEWFERQSVQLVNGDFVAAPVPWSPPEDSASLEQRIAIKAGIEQGSPCGPWSAKLSGDARSVRHLFEQHGLVTKAGQQNLVRDLAAEGWSVAEYRGPGRQTKQGLRSPDGLPSNVTWICPDTA